MCQPFFFVLFGEMGLMERLRLRDILRMGCQLHAKMKLIRVLLLDDGGGIVRLWALLNYCVMVFGGAVL